MVDEDKLQSLAQKACEDFMTSSDLQTVPEIKMAAQMLLMVAQVLYKTVHDEGLEMDTVN